MALFDRPLSLMVSLPANDPELAAAAAAGGADALKTHINVGHRASGTVFGSIEEERGGLTGVLEVGLATGLVVGGAGAVDREQMAVARDLGFAFFDVYAQHAPAWYVQAAGDRLAMAAVGHDDVLERATGLPALGIGAVEASLCPPEGYHTPLTLDLLADVARLVSLVDIPVVVPTQRAIHPDDVPGVAATGAAALLIGAVVTGTEPDGVRATTAAFRRAMDALPTSTGGTT